MFKYVLVGQHLFGGFMKKMITTKDLMALNELMTFENWMATKMKFCEQAVTEKPLKAMFKEMATKHLENHSKLLAYLNANSSEGGNK